MGVIPGAGIRIIKSIIRTVPGVDGRAIVGRRIPGAAIPGIEVIIPVVQIAGCGVLIVVQEIVLIVSLGHLRR
jgi:hypothetical protein